jgi:hypothetical protein
MNISRDENWIARLGRTEIIGQALTCCDITIPFIRAELNAGLNRLRQLANHDLICHDVPVGGGC